MIETGKWLEEASLADSWGGIAILFSLFCYFFLGSLGYGWLLRRAWRARGGLLESTSDSFLFASAFLWMLATVLASSHGLGKLPVWAVWALFFPGFLFSYPLLRQLLDSARYRHAYFLVLFAFIFLLRALTAALPARHGDPLLYHLLGPRLWMEAGGFTMHAQLPNALLASTWEVLYLWPQMLWFSTRPLFGLVEAQIFSQWLHLFLAWAGCAILLMRLFQLALRPLLLPFVGLAALFVSGLHWTAPLAKNDVGISFWVLGAVVYFVDAHKKRSSSHALLSGFFAGLALSGKITALLSLAPLLFVCVLSFGFWRQWRFFLEKSLLWGIGLLLGALPIYLRNYVLSGNPFFPMFSKFFPSPFLAPSYEAHFAQVQPSNPLTSVSRIWLRAPELWRESPFIPVAIGLMLVALIFVFRGRRAKEKYFYLPLLGGGLLAYLLFVLTQAREIELRYLGASLMILAGGGVVLLLDEIHRISSAKVRHGAIALLLVAVLASSKLPLHVAKKIWREPLGVAHLRTHSAGEAKEWLRKHAGSEFTVMVGDNESYYLTPISHAVLSERADLDRATKGETSFPLFVEKLCELSHARYLFDVRPEIGIFSRFGSALPESATVFSAQGARIYDLEKVESKLSPALRKCNR